MMEVRVLRYFLAVAREESISKAADALHITQPTLSRQMTQLEEETGVRLFTRGTRKITLTNEGMLLRRRAEEILELVDKTEKELNQQDELVEGRISIGCGEIQSVEILVGLLASFRKKYPLVTYDLYTATADQVKEKIEAGILDMGLLLEPIDMGKYEYVRLKSRERWVALMQPDDPLAEKEAVSAKDLAQKPLIIASRPNVQNELANWFGNGFDKLNILCRSNLPTNGAMMVRHGMGYSLVVEGLTFLWDKKQIVSRPLYPELTASCVLVWKRRQPFGQAAAKLIEYIGKMGRERQN